MVAIEPWNCDDKTSGCFVDEMETVIVICDTERPCINTTVSCDDGLHGEMREIPDGGCRLVCNGWSGFMQWIGYFMFIQSRTE